VPPEATHGFLVSYKTMSSDDIGPSKNASDGPICLLFLSALSQENVLIRQGCNSATAQRAYPKNPVVC